MTTPADTQRVLVDTPNPHLPRLPDGLFVALYEPVSLLGDLICWQTRGPVSHAALWWAGMCYEADKHEGVICRPFRPRDPEAKLYQLRNHHEIDLGILHSFLEAQVGKPYDTSMVIRFVTRKQASRKQAGRWFCSELVFAALREAGITLFPDTEPWEVSPRLLMRSPLLKRIPNLLVRQ